MHTRFLLACLKRREHLGNLGVGGRIILKWLCKNGVRTRTDGSG
jgi:hypothetical protein